MGGIHWFYCCSSTECSTMDPNYDHNEDLWNDIDELLREDGFNLLEGIVEPTAPATVPELDLGPPERWTPHVGNGGEVNALHLCDPPASPINTSMSVSDPDEDPTGVLKNNWWTHGKEQFKEEGEAMESTINHHAVRDCDRDPEPKPEPAAPVALRQPNHAPAGGCCEGMTVGPVPQTFEWQTAQLAACSGFQPSGQTATLSKRQCLAVPEGNVYVNLQTVFALSALDEDLTGFLNGGWRTHVEEQPKKEEDAADRTLNPDAVHEVVHALVHSRELDPAGVAPVTLAQPDHRPAGACGEGVNVGAAPQKMECQTPEMAAPNGFQPLQASGQCVSVPDESVFVNMQTVFALNGLLWHPHDPVAPPPNTFTSLKRTRSEQHDTSHIKKPPNAFMLFLKEQRPIVSAQLGVTESAVVNKEAGKRWKMLSKHEKEKYFEQARAEAWVHAQKYPGWSNVENYGKKRPRRRVSVWKQNTEALREGDIIRDAVSLSALQLAGGQIPSTSGDAARFSQAAVANVNGSFSTHISPLIPSAHPSSHSIPLIQRTLQEISSVGPHLAAAAAPQPFTS